MTPAKYPARILKLAADTRGSVQDTATVIAVGDVTPEQSGTLIQDLKSEVSRAIRAAYIIGKAEK